jgi:hypothetical protein
MSLVCNATALGMTGDAEIIREMSLEEVTEANRHDTWTINAVTGPVNSTCPTKRVPRAIGPDLFTTSF